MNNEIIRRIEENPWWLLALLGSVLFVFMLGGHSFWDIDEPINAQCAKEMFEAGNWFVPMFNGELRSGKPILTYWFMLTSYALFGISEFSARLPEALSITALAMVITYFGRRLADNRTGLLAGLMFISSIHIVVIGRAATPDAIFMLTLCTGLLAGLCYIVEDLKPKRILWLAYGCFGLAALAKGPVSIAVPGMILTAYLLLAGRFSLWRDFHPFKGLAIILLVAMPWYIIVAVMTEGQWVKDFLFTHNLHRFSAPMEGHKGFPGFYLVTITLGLFPWAGAFIGMLINAPWRLIQFREKPMHAFLLVWLVVFFLFFSIAQTRLPNYVLPAFPAIALLMALWVRDHSWERVSKYLLWGASVITAALLIGGGGALQHQWPGEWVYALAFVPLAIGVLLAWQNRDRLVPWFVAGMLGMALLLAGWVMPEFEKHKVTRPFAQAATAAGFGCGELSSYRYFQPSLVFYHCAPIHHRTTLDETLVWLEAGKALVMPTSALDELPESMRSKIVVYERGVGLYARRELVLVSLPR